MTKRRVPRLQHYVPQFLLKNFHREGKDLLFVYDKEQRKKFSSPSRNIASENGFYNFGENAEHTLEFGLGDIEGQAASVIRKILKSESAGVITDDEKVLLSSFLAIQFVRTKYYRNYLRDSYLQVSYYLSQRFGVEAMDEFLGAMPDDEKTKVKSLADITSAPEQFATFFYQKDWFLMRSQAKDFYISDNPVSTDYNQEHRRLGGYGIGSEGVEIYFPLTSSMTLSMYCPTLKEKLRGLITQVNAMLLLSMDLVDRTPIEKATRYLNAISNGGVLDVDSEQVKRLNSLQVKSSERFVMSSNGDFQLIDTMLTHNSSYSMGPRLRIG